jgi:RNase P/RNase MRP subunit p29
MDRALSADRSREANETLAGELIGAGIAIVEAPGLRTLPLEGTIVDESMGTFEIRLAPSGRRIRVAKQGLRGTIVVGERELPLNGEVLRMRPQDRTKRLLQAGPRRLR